MADVRLAVYEHILATGRVPHTVELADNLRVSSAAVAAELQRLQQIHAFALAPASDEILMAHPFFAVPTPYVVHAW